MSDFMGLFFMECSYSDIKNSLRTFQNMVHAFIYVQLVVIIYFVHAVKRTSTGPTRH